MTVLKSAYGSVKPYTRHVESCPHRRERDFNVCACPKWLYTRHDGKRKRKSLNTPSWAEAQRIATDRLRAMDPEIAAARATNEKNEQQLVSVKDAADLWLQRCMRQHGRVYPQYRTVAAMLISWAADHGIDFIQDVKPIALEKWYGSREWLRLAETTRNQRWIDVRSLFTYVRDCGLISESPAARIKPVRPSGDLVQGPYSEEQVAAILAHVGDSLPEGTPPEQHAVHTARLHAFILLLLNVGCDVMDAVLHADDRIEQATVEGKTVDVCRYKRVKTGVTAIVPLAAEVAQTLRSVPRLPENPPAMPFRDPRLQVVSDTRDWSQRVRQVLKAAKVDWVDLPGADQNGRPRRKAANTKQFRHTFAVRQLVAGQRPEEVAKMLGHVDTNMVRRHYAPWVAEMDQAHIGRVVKNWAATAPAK